MYLKKWVFTPIITLVFIAIPTNVSAATTAELLAQIESLLAIVTSLQTQLAALGNVPEGSAQTVSERQQYRVAITRERELIRGSSTCIQLTRNLWLGLRDSETNGDISRLQQFLTSTDDYTYGEITGYYGPATLRAVQRWQARNDIVSYGTPDSTGYGVVGPKTRFVMDCGSAMLKPTPLRDLCIGVTVPNKPTSCTQSIEAIYNPQGCQTGWQCVSVTEHNSCPSFPAPICSNNQTYHEQRDAMGCVIARECIGKTANIKVDVDGNYFINLVYENLPVSKIILASVDTGDRFDIDNNVQGSGGVELDEHNKKPGGYYISAFAHQTGEEVARSGVFYLGGNYSPLPDLFVEAVLPQQGSSTGSTSAGAPRFDILRGQPLWNVVFKNNGEPTTAHFDVRYELKDEFGKLLSSRTLSRVANYYLTHQYPFSMLYDYTPGRYKYSIFINPTSRLKESHYGNNRFEGTFEIIAGTVEPIAHIGIISPNGGENLTIGKPYKISWNEKGVKRITIDLYQNDNWIRRILNNQVTEAENPNSGGTGSYEWLPEVASEFASLGSVFKIKITGEKADGTGFVDDKSDTPFKFSNTSTDNAYEDSLSGGFDLFVTRPLESSVPTISGSASGTNVVQIKVTSLGVTYYDSGPTPVTDGRWSVTTQSLEKGHYALQLWDAVTGKHLTSTTINVVAELPIP